MVSGGFELITCTVHYISSISSTSDHQALNLGGWGPLL